MASHPAVIGSDIAEHNDRSSYKEEVKGENSNIKGIESHEEQAQARLNWFTKDEEEAVIGKLNWHLMP
jgi:hypothetical protein